MTVKVAAGLLLAFVAAGCGGSPPAPSSVVRGYESAIFARDGGKVCASFTPALREVLEQRIESVEGQSFDCGQYYGNAIGYPNENMERQFVGGRLVSIGAVHRVHAGGVEYLGVAATTRIDFKYTSYALQNGESGRVTLHEIVWLAESHGRWGVVKPSPTLFAATNADAVVSPKAVAHMNAAPPDPEYTR
jgi:hypothetical protein